MASAANVKTDAERVIAVAKAEHASWLRAYEEQHKKGGGFTSSAETCLSIANAVELVIKRMERELRKATAA